MTDEAQSGRDSIDQGRVASGRINRRDSVGSDKERRPVAVERRVSGRSSFSSSLSEVRRLTLSIEFHETNEQIHSISATEAAI